MTVYIIQSWDTFARKVKQPLILDYQVGELKAPINFKKLIGFDDYQR